MSFVHLHLHTIYSFLDGLVRPGQLMGEIKKLGMDSVAITDHGNMHGVIEFYLAAKDAGIKPIIGLESYISAGSRKEKVSKDAFHLVLLAENEIGYKNLCYLNSQAFVDGFYYKPRIDRDLLKDHSEGIIALSACLGGEISRALMNGNQQHALNVAKEYQDIFGKDNFFIEIQVNGLDDQEKVNPMLIEVAKEIGAPLVGTNDVHYLTPENATAQEVLFAITAKTTLDDKENRLHHESSEFYLKSEEDMKQLFEKYGQDGIDAVENTGEIAKRCNVELDIGSHYLPQYDTGGISLAEYLEKISLEGLEERFDELGIDTDEKKDEYFKRLDYELGIINQMGFPGYFLIVADFIQWAKDNNIPVGPGRGSGAGSLVAYATKITDLDPLRYGLFFERFLNPERVSMPDFDVDFCQDNRDKVIEYVTNKYGSSNVAQIATFGKLKAKSAVRDVGRALAIDLAVTDKLAKMVPENLSEMLRPQWGKKTKDITKDILMGKYNISKSDADDPDRLKAAIKRCKIEKEDKELVESIISGIDAYEKERELIRNTEDYRRIIEIADQIEGLLRQPGKHACGMVIGDKPIYEYSPIFVDKDNYRVTQYDKTMVELAGLVKFDFLGLKTLTMIKHAERLVQEKVPDFDINAITIDDKETYSFFCNKSTKGVFQMESPGFEKMIHQMKPDCIEDLIAGVALYRPGPMDIIPNYIRRKHGREEIVYDHPWLEDILKETNGLIVYQEQVMQISQKMAGFSLGKADILRRAMGKKKIKDMERMKIEFAEGAKEKGIDEAVARKVFDHMEKFASYGFNKSHAACYGYISYQTAYLKTHYPVEFFAALISSESQDATKVLSYISDAANMGIDVFPPDINNSFYSFSIEDSAIRFGLGAIKNVGEGAIEEIIKERGKNGAFTSLYDFTSRINQSRVNARTIEYLIKSGAFDFTGLNRGVLISILPAASDQGEKLYKDKLAGQMSLFGSFGGSGNEDVSDDVLLKNVETESWDIFDTLALEKEVLGVYLTNHPAKLFKKDAQQLGLISISDVYHLVTGKGYFSRKKMWIAGIISTDIKPIKGRDNDYYLKGIIEGADAAINYSVNKIENPSANPLLEKLKSKMPLLFNVKVRALRNKDDGTIEGVSASIDNLAEDVKTFSEYVEFMQDGLSRFSVVVDTDNKTLDSKIPLLKQLKTRVSEDDKELSIITKINYPDKKASAYLESLVFISEKTIKDMKDQFGADSFYLFNR